MEARPRLIYRLLQWTFVACVAAALWTAGYFGGRSAGRETGYADGLVPAAEGIELGRIDAIQEFFEGRARESWYAHVYDVRALVAKRLGKKPGETTNPKETAKALAELADDIYRDVRPEMEFDDGPVFKIRSVPTDQTLVIQANAPRHTELAVYLKSREDYFAWRATQEPSSLP